MQNPYEKYKEQSVMTMTQGDMINLLFNEMINRLNKGLACLAVKDYEGTNTYFQKSQIIVSHLAASLDHQYSVTEGLEALYEYFYHQILQANIRKTPEPVEEILPMLVELKEAFAQADRQVRVEHTG